MGGKIDVSSENHQTIFKVALPSANIERQAKNAVSYSDNR